MLVTEITENLVMERPHRLVGHVQNADITFILKESVT